MNRRKRSDSLDAAVEFSGRLEGAIQPPLSIGLSTNDLQFWPNIVLEKPKAEWTAHDLDVAGHLAQAMSDLVVARKRLRETGGPVIVDDRGKAVNNPFSQAVRDETARIVLLRSTLQIHGRGKSGEMRETIKRREVMTEIASAFADDGAGLLN